MITANIATMRSRQSILQRMVNSVKYQVDLVRIYANDYTPVVDGAMVVTGKDLTDRGKFAFVRPGEVYFSMDDDLLYPQDYVSNTISAMKRYPGHIVTYHGRILSGKGKNYYYGHESIHCLHRQEHDREIDVPGTGVSAFDTDYFCPNILQYDNDCMADVLLGLEAARRSTHITALAHDMGWLSLLWNPKKGSIYNDHHDNCSIQSILADEIYSIKYE